MLYTQHAIKITLKMFTGKTGRGRPPKNKKQDQGKDDTNSSSSDARTQPGIREKEPDTELRRNPLHKKAGSNSNPASKAASTAKSRLSLKKYTDMCLCVGVCACMYTYMQVYLYTYIYTYLYSNLGKQI